MDDEFYSKDFSLSSYINRKFSTYSYSAINSSYNALKHQSLDLNVNILTLLNVDFDYSIYNRSVNLLKKTKQLLRQKEIKSEEFYLYKENIEKFKEALNLFAENLSMFINESRFLEEIFYVDLKIKSGKFIQKDIEMDRFREGLLILANDIILIGIKKKNFEKYVLLNTYSYGNLSLTLKTNLQLETSSASFEIRAGDRKLYRIKGIYDKYTYVEQKKEEAKENSNRNLFFYETEQYGKINEKKKFQCADFHLKIRRIEDLKLFIRIGDQEIIFYRLFKKNFPEFSFDNFIKIYFEYFNNFISEQEKYVKRELNLILYEKELRFTLKVVMKQVLWRGRKYNEMNDLWEEVKKQCPVEYLLVEYEKKIKEWKKNRINFSKEELRKSVENFMKD